LPALPAVEAVPPNALVELPPLPAMPVDDLPPSVTGAPPEVDPAEPPSVIS
jgi:hypothetical protein